MSEYIVKQTFYDRNESIERKVGEEFPKTVGAKRIDFLLDLGYIKKIEEKEVKKDGKKL